MDRDQILEGTMPTRQLVGPFDELSMEQEGGKHRAGVKAAPHHCRDEAPQEWECLG